jgi:hypothetical protein
MQQYIRPPDLMPVHFSRTNKIGLLWNVSPITQSNHLRFIRGRMHFLLHGFIILSGKYRAIFSCRLVYYINVAHSSDRSNGGEAAAGSDK